MNAQAVRRQIWYLLLLILLLPAFLSGKILQQKPKTPALVLVDMPGYGFAYMSEADTQRCKDLSTRYLHSNIVGGETGKIKDFIYNFGEIKNKSKNLKRVMLLLDARHGLKYADVQFFNTFYLELAEEFKHLLVEIREKEQNDLISGKKSKKSVQKVENSGVQKETYINSNNAPLDNSPEALELRVQEKFNARLSKILAWKLQIVLTKCDLIERTELCRRVQVLTKEIHAKLPSVFKNELPIVILSGEWISYDCMLIT